MRFLVLVAAVLLSFYSNIACAAGDTISKIVVENNQRVEEETVKSYLDFKAGSKFDQNKINSSLKKLFASGLFSDVSFARSGSQIIIKVVESPIINKVSFEGNKRITSEILTGEISLSPRSVYTKGKVQEDTNKIQEAYRRSGRYDVTVNPKVVELDQNRVNLIFEINEGKKATVKKINFIGNHYFDNEQLKKVLNTKESHWYSFLSSNDTYDQDKVAFDKELLRKLYISKGYADFRVTSSTAEITKDKQSFVITFTVEEGEKYTFGDIKVTSTLPSLQVDTLNSSLKTKKGETYNANEVDSTIEAITTKLNDFGYAFVDINTEYNRNEKDHIMGITYTVSEGPKVYINRINITGNVRTLDKVIRREFRLGEGDPFNAAKIRRSKQRIENLGFFDKVDVDSERTDQADKANLKVAVTEKSTGELSFGVGYSTHDGALGNVGLQEHNLMGRGQDLKLTLQRSQAGLTAELGFTEPYFMDKDLSAGFDIWDTKSSRINDDVSSLDTIGLSPRLSYSLTEHLRHTIRYTIQQDDVTNIRDDASLLVKSQAGQTISSTISHLLMWDYRDNRFEPRDGFYVSFEQKLAGLGGDIKNIRHELKGGYYIPVYKDKLTLKFDASAGIVNGYGGKEVRFADNFRLTGRKIRGFENIGFGPTDFSASIDNGTVLGGKRYYAESTQLDFPLAFVPDELGFKGFVFHDIGAITDVDNNIAGLSIVDNNSLHASAGFGFSWVSPLGPLNVSYGIPYMKESFDKEQRFQFDFGTRF
jgi:outer membrane protein insertion porin family